MKNLKLNELSKQQMNQITGGEGAYAQMGTYNGRPAKISYDKVIVCDPYGEKPSTLEPKVYCVCGCVYANQGGSSTEANFTANDAHNLKSF